jgi:hypothetical protein
MKYSLARLLIVLASISPALYGNVLQLEKDFKNPPHSAKPLTWMHFMSGNISRDGITKDLEAIADAGIGGIILFNVTHQIPNGPVQFNSPEHIALTAHAAAECERLGLSFGIHNCDGWTSSGGPWVPVEHSMKQVVYRETVIDGGQIDLILPGPTQRGGFYRDIAVLAYPALQPEVVDAGSRPIITSSDPGFDINIATNGKVDELTELTLSDGEEAWIQWDFGKPQTVRAFYLNTEKQRGNKGAFLQCSANGVDFEDIETLRVYRHGKYEYTIDTSFEEVNARYFRFVTRQAMDISEVRLGSTPRIKNLSSRINIVREDKNVLGPLEEVDSSMIIGKETIRDLSAFVKEHDVLKTTLPDGKWTIMRFGYTTTGAINDPASIAGTGWEVDKFSRESFGLFFDGYVKNVIEASREIAPNALQFVEIDSYEVGGQNWTQGYEELFRAEYGYELVDFLPLYAGRIVDSADTATRVLWDVRNLNSKLMCDNYFGTFTELCHANDLKSYIEPYGNGPFNTLDAARHADIPMGEFHESGKFMTDVAISAGHIYGKNIISAEAFTSGPRTNFEAHPGQWKAVGDRAWSAGINEFVFHTYAHQANTKVSPGMTMSGFGAQINRMQTWWDSAGKSWFQYIARGQTLLRRGVPVADLLVFVGDGSPNSAVARSRADEIPYTINYDSVNTDVLMNRVSVQNGKLVLPEGTRYHALYLKNLEDVHLSTLKRLAELADQGAIIVGKKPQGLGGYGVSPEDKAAFKQLVSEIWSLPTTQEDADWSTIYEAYNIPLDLVVDDGKPVDYTHRKAEGLDIYFLYNPEDSPRTLTGTFNVDGKQPELWDALTGEITGLRAYEHRNGKTEAILELPANGSRFVVFRKSSDKPPPVALPLLVDTHELKGPWEVEFPGLKNGPRTLTFPELADWTSFQHEGIRHYSGTATYRKIFVIKESFVSANRRFTLDLGEVHIAARVSLNGRDMGVAWCEPYQLDITSALKAGPNEIRIDVTNQWRNRLIGDEAFPNLTGYDLRPHMRKPLLVSNPELSLINEYKMVDWYSNNEPALLGERSTFTTYPFFEKGDELIPAGLIGPVKITASESRLSQP